MAFSNSAGAAGNQAVALRIKGDQSAFLNCRFDGYQDTLYVHCWRQFFRDCTITGTIDFIFGNSGAVFQNCDIIVNAPDPGQQNTVTASGKLARGHSINELIHICSMRACIDIS
jgi:pectinesterase